MEIIFASTGVECVAAPSRGIIYLDPTLDYQSAIDAIQASLPTVHVDAIRHWVEKAMPSATPLSRRMRQAAAPKSPWRKRNRRAIVAVMLLALGAAGLAGAQWAKQRYVDNIFDEPVFAKLATERGWVCDRAFNEPMTGGCVTAHGITLRITATASDRLTSFWISYERSGTHYLDRLIVFDSANTLQAWMNLEHANAQDGLHPNLVTFSNWALYGTDNEKVAVCAYALKHGTGSAALSALLQINPGTAV